MSQRRPFPGQSEGSPFVCPYPPDIVDEMCGRYIAQVSRGEFILPAVSDLAMVNERGDWYRKLQTAFFILAPALEKAKAYEREAIFYELELVFSECNAAYISVSPLRYLDSLRLSESDPNTWMKLAMASDHDHGIPRIGYYPDQVIIETAEMVFSAIWMLLLVLLSPNRETGAEELETAFSSLYTGLKAGLDQFNASGLSRPLLQGLLRIDYELSQLQYPWAGNDQDRKSQLFSASDLQFVRHLCIRLSRRAFYLLAFLNRKVSGLLPSPEHATKSRILDFSSAYRTFIESPLGTSELPGSPTTDGEPDRSITLKFLPDPDSSDSSQRSTRPARVVNTETWEFEFDAEVFQDSYAVLSHVWSRNQEELTYDEFLRSVRFARMKRDFIHSNRLEAAFILWKLSEDEDMDGGSKDGFVRWLKAHLQQQCEVLRTSIDPGTESRFGIYGQDTYYERKYYEALHACHLMGIKYLWIDSCCIRKTDHVELAESISCMGDWYSKAAVCIVYLQDCSSGRKIPQQHVWGSRGWTLQEIIMPRRALIFNGIWRLIGDTTIPEHKAQIAQISHILPDLVCYGEAPKIAASLIMQFASRRVTTRPEDRAYSLLGILGLRMTPDYGEGESRAVQRLLEQIVKVNKDVSVFNWSGHLGGSRIHGRSMFPRSFSFYTLHQEGQLGGLGAVPTPMTSNTLVEMTHNGVHSTFDVWHVDIQIEDDNEQSYQVLQRLKETAPLNTICHVNATAYLIPRDSSRPREKICEMTIHTELDSIDMFLDSQAGEMKKQLEPRSELLATEFSRPWVLARVDTFRAKWFLCGCENWYPKSLDEPMDMWMAGPHERPRARRIPTTIMWSDELQALGMEPRPDKAFDPEMLMVTFVNKFSGYGTTKMELLMQ